MPKYKTLDEAYNLCKEEGSFREIEILDINRIKTILKLSEALTDSGNDIKKGLDNKSMKWSVVFSIYYDAFHSLAEIIGRFDKIKIANHQCLFAYLCKSHPELELSWDFFEKIRTKRNGIMYYGSPATYEDWKEIEVQIQVYIITLKKYINKKLGIKEKSFDEIAEPLHKAAKEIGLTKEDLEEAIKEVRKKKN